MATAIFIGCSAIATNGSFRLKGFMLFICFFCMVYDVVMLIKH